MRIALFLLFLFATLMVALAQEHPTFFDYKELPSCARSCKILSTSELNCLPRAAPVSNFATYISCFCQSDYLKSLHASGEICHQFCSDEDDLAIYAYYNELCGMSHSSPSSSTIMLLAPTSTSSLMANEPTNPPPAPPLKVEDKGKDHRAWLHHNWKYLVAAGVLILVTLVILFSLTFFHRCNRKKQDVKRVNRHSSLIPLQLVPSTARSRPTTSSEDNLQNLPGPAVSSPQELLGTPHSFSASFRFYAREIEENNAKRMHVRPQRLDESQQGGR